MSNARPSTRRGFATRRCATSPAASAARTTSLDDGFFGRPEADSSGSSAGSAARFVGATRTPPCVGALSSHPVPSRPSRSAARSAASTSASVETPGARVGGSHSRSSAPSAAIAALDVSAAIPGKWLKRCPRRIVAGASAGSNSHTTSAVAARSAPSAAVTTRNEASAANARDTAARWFDRCPSTSPEEASKTTLVASRATRESAEPGRHAARTSASSASARGGARMTRAEACAPRRLLGDVARFFALYVCAVRFFNSSRATHPRVRTSSTVARDTCASETTRVFIWSNHHASIPGCDGAARAARRRRARGGGARRERPARAPGALGARALARGGDGASPARLPPGRVRVAKQSNRSALVARLARHPASPSPPAPRAPPPTRPSRRDTA